MVAVDNACTPRVDLKDMLMEARSAKDSSQATDAEAKKLTEQEQKSTNETRDQNANLEDGHAVDGRVLVVLRGAVDAVVGAYDDGHVRVFEVVVDLVCKAQRVDASIR